MLTISDNFAAANAAPELDPRYAVRISFHNDSTTGFERNIVLQSEDFDTTWSKQNSCTVFPNSDIAPDGNTTADTITDSNPSGASYLLQTITGIDGDNQYTCSFFVKKDSTPRTTRFGGLKFIFTDAGFALETNEIYFDTESGEYEIDAQESDNVSAGVVDYDANYWRFWITAKPAAAGKDEIRLQFYPAIGATPNWQTGSNPSGSIIGWGMQVSNSDGPIDYVATTTAPNLTADPDSNVIWLTSHDDTLLPTVSPTSKFANCITRRGISGQSQKIDPLKGRASIGTLTIKAQDIGGLLSDRIYAELEDGNGLRQKQIQLYKGHAALDSFDDYTLYRTYIIDQISYHGGVYTFTCSDIQRTVKDRIFVPHEGNLESSITASSTSIPVVCDSADKFPILDHDAIYSANPSDEVGYIQIDDEIICHDGGTYSAGVLTLNVVERGALGTVPMAHSVTAIEVAQRKKVTELVYFEMPAPKAAYAILTGDLEGQVGKTLPNHWHLGIPTRYVKLAEFTGIGADLWDTSNNTGRLVRFIGLEGVEGKKFIEEEILIYLGCFMPVRSDGALGLQRLGNVTPEAGYDVELGEYEITRYGPLTHDMRRLINSINIHYNWIQRLERYTRKPGFIDAASILKHQVENTRVFKFRGVFAGNQAESNILNFFEFVRDRYADPPEVMTIEVDPEFDYLEVGDTVRVVNPQVRSFNAATSQARTFEIQQHKVDWLSGKIVLELFGGVGPPSQLSLSDSNVMSDAFYSSTGTELSTVLTIAGDAITANGSLTGGADAGSNVFYYDGALTLNAGVTLTIDRNVQLRIKGGFTVNGTIELDGNAADGGLGKAVTGYSCDVYIRRGPQSGDVIASWFRRHLPAAVAVGEHGAAMPLFNIINPDGASLEGVPGDLSGVPGPTGPAARIREEPSTVNTAAGGAGGVGGGGCVCICRGFTIGINGSIDLSGEDGSIGSTAAIGGAGGITVAGQSGAGGAPGGFLILIDGDYSGPDLGANNITAIRGATPSPTYDEKLPEDGPMINPGDTGYGQVIGAGGNAWSSCVRVQYIPPAENGYTWLPEDERKQTNPNRPMLEVLLLTNMLEIGTPNAAATTNEAIGANSRKFILSNSLSELWESKDGRAWTQISDGYVTNDSGRAIQYLDDYWLVVGDNAGTTGFIMYSDDDGATWGRTSPAGSSWFWDIGFGNGVFVAVGLDDGTDAAIFTATDPAGTWTERSNPKAEDLRGITYSPELDLWVAVGESDGTDAYLLTATDPTGTWTERSNPGSLQVLNSVTWGNGRFVAVGDDGSDYHVIYSADGITWTEASSIPDSQGDLRKVKYIDGFFVATGNSNATGTPGAVWLSADGDIWAQVENQAADKIWDFDFNGHAFVFIELTNSSNIVRSANIQSL